MIHFVVPCGLLDNNDKIEIDRYKRFLLLLDKVKRDYGEIPSTVDWIFCEVGDRPKLEGVIRKRIPEFKYYHIEGRNFNQINIINRALAEVEDNDFIVYTHSDTLLFGRENIYRILLKRLININKNYYLSRFELFGSVDFTELRFENRKVSAFDYGFKYILDKSNCYGYSDTMPILTFSNVPENLIQDFSYVPSVMCFTKKNFESLSINPSCSYHNDVVIRDLSAIKGIGFEWLNDEMIALHLHGLDDTIKSMIKDYEVSFEIVKAYPELVHYLLFRFNPSFVDTIKKISTVGEIRDLYLGYLKDRYDKYVPVDYLKSYNELVSGNWN